MTGKIPERQFRKLINQYDEEQLTLENKIAEMEQTQSRPLLRKRSQSVHSTCEAI
jgi:hypothetical protein